MDSGTLQSGGRDTAGRGLWLVVPLLTLWATYSLNGFRMPVQPIELSDSDAGSAMRQALYAGSACAAMLYAWMSGRLWWVIRTQWRLVALAAWLGLTVLYSDLPSTTLKRVILFTCGACTASVAVSCFRRPVRDAAFAVFLMGAGAAVVSLVWMVVFPPGVTTNPARPGLAGISNHPNTLAPALAIAVTLGIGIPMEKPSASLAKWAGVFCCALALFLTGSVTSILMALVCVLSYAAIMATAYWRVVFGLLAGVIATFVGLLGPARVSAMLFSSVGRDASMSGRDALWASVIERVTQAPLFGSGWGAFWVEGRGRELVSTWNPRQSHNAYLDVLLDTGVVGGVFFALFLVPAAGVIWAQRQKQQPPAEASPAAAVLGVASGLFLIYGLQQSFVGKVDAFAFIAVLLCAVAAMEARGRMLSAALPLSPPPDPSDGSRLTEST